MQGGFHPAFICQTEDNVQRAKLISTGAHWHQECQSFSPAAKADDCPHLSQVNLSAQPFRGDMSVCVCVCIYTCADRVAVNTWPPVSFI